jgi:endonuclease/exonuclease/phosphatase (EEP) superfamily protein YafD
VQALRDGLPNWRVQRVGDVLLLTRITAQRPDVVAVAHDLAWVGPKAGIRKFGRSHMLVNDTVLIVHRITGGPSGPNEYAFSAESDLIRATLTGYEVALCVGDQNATASELAAWWRSHGMTPVRTGAKVDHGGERGLTITARKLRRYYGSDHTPVIYTIHKETP